MFKKIYAHLKNNNIDCCSIGQHEGKCVKPYVVIKDMGKAKTNNSVVYKKMVELYVYYPLGNYSMVEGFINEIEEIDYNEKDVVLTSKFIEQLEKIEKVNTRGRTCYKSIY